MNLANYFINIMKNTEMSKKFYRFDIFRRRVRARGEELLNVFVFARAQSIAISLGTPGQLKWKFSGVDLDIF